MWTAWDGSDVYQRETTATPERASGPGTEDHTFSARLRQVSLTPISLTEAPASSCQGNAGADGYQARWASKVVPYVYGFDVAKSSLARMVQWGTEEINQTLQRCRRWSFQAIHAGPESYSSWKLEHAEVYADTDLPAVSTLWLPPVVSDLAFGYICILPMYNDGVIFPIVYYWVEWAVNSQFPINTRHVVVDS